MRDADQWSEAIVQRPGDPDEAVTVKDERVVGGEYKRDILWVLRVADDTIDSYRYEHVRPEPPHATR